ncbi:Diguanylate cyclase DosC [Polystyrenella longa]|uniref:diguanylate cyclase n=1 Tax=Polystyrenella longa TaxID=2528007 RepID=A0A518CGR6_9PLAN|nr:GGDEF domain-containing protein [Polystyrenella longa]QDU78413.1 Diguanylate cyclase DosC [Polystyrenella longa]
MIDPKKIWSSNNLPSLPMVAIELLELSKDTDSEVSDYIRLVKSDPAITAKILKATNSSYAGFKNPITSIDRAVPLLGATVVTSLALSFSLSDAAHVAGPMATCFKNYWRSSVVKAAACEVIALEYNPGSESDFFLAGLLSSLGRLAMLKTIPQDYLKVIETFEESEDKLLHEVETELLGVNHIEAGLNLMISWKIPSTIQLCVRHQADPPEVINAIEPSQDLDMVRAVAVANAVGSYFCTHQKGIALQRLQLLTASFYKWSDKDLEDRLLKMKERIDLAAEVFSVDTSEIESLNDIMAEAGEQLAMLAMRAHVASTQAVVRQQIIEEEVKQLEQKNQELTEQAIRDVLTGTYNRKFFDESLRKEIARAARSATTIGVIFLDIDNFKKLNDTYGHQFGDDVLKQVSARMEDTLRTTDLLGRYGGEEFVALVSQPTKKGLTKVADRLRAAIESLKILFNNKQVPVTISVGACIAMPRRNGLEVGERLVTESDAAMYDSKRNGRNQVHVRSIIDPIQEQLTQLSNQKRFSRWLVRHGHARIEEVSQVLLDCHFPHEKIGVLAQNSGYLTAEQVEQILDLQRQSDERFGVTAIAQGFLTEEQVAYLLAMQQEDAGQVAQALAAKGCINDEILYNLMNIYKHEVDPSRPAKNAVASDSAT